MTTDPELPPSDSEREQDSNSSDFDLINALENADIKEQALNSDSWQSADSEDRSKTSLVDSLARQESGEMPPTLETVAMGGNFANRKVADTTLGNDTPTRARHTRYLSLDSSEFEYSERYGTSDSFSENGDHPKTTQTKNGGNVDKTGSLAHLLEHIKSPQSENESIQLHPRQLMTQNSDLSSGSTPRVRRSPKPFDDAHSTFVQSAKHMQTQDVSVVDEVFLADDMAQEASRNFAMEHRIYIQAALELLTQKDRFASEIVMNDSDTIKAGPLRKAAHLRKGFWKVKYVEIRRGSFSYYEDVAKDTEEGELVRKDIPLVAGSFTCRPVKITSKALQRSPTSGAIFEVTVDGRPRRLWMANSREERRAWIQAVQEATVGGSVIRGGDQSRPRRKKISSRSPYKKDIELYLKTQRTIKNAATKAAYLGAVSKLVGHPLNIPVQWIMKLMGVASSETADKAFHDEGVVSGVNQLWKDLLRDSVQINNELFAGDSGHAPEKIIGSLMSGIMEFDKSSPIAANASEAQKRKYCVTESQALSYARDILLCANRTRSAGDSYYCVSTLCSNPALVVMVPSSMEAKPLSVTISHLVEEKNHRMNEKSGWLRTRSKPNRAWKRRYFVLSEGTLSYYEQALPRPHGLRGQIKLLDSTLNAIKRAEVRRSSVSQDKTKPPSDHFIVSILGREGFVDRQILFESEDKFIPWAHSLDIACRCESETKEPPAANSAISRFRRLNLREESVSVQPSGIFGPPLKDYPSLLGLDREATVRRMQELTEGSFGGRSTVKIIVQASTDYKICTVDPQGDAQEDTWVTIRAIFRQCFDVCGGPNGRMNKEEEIVQVNVLSCPIIPSSTPPRHRANRIVRRLRSEGSNSSSHK